MIIKSSMAAALVVATAGMIVSMPAMAQNQVTSPMPSYNFNGKWIGNAGPQWEVDFRVVKPGVGDLRMYCRTYGRQFGPFHFIVGADGTLTPQIIRTGEGLRKIGGKLPLIDVENSGSCGGGTAVMQKVS